MVIEKKVILEVFRFDPEVDKGPRYDSFTIDVKKGMTVLEGLLHILDVQDHSLALRFACREGVCGSCAMFINGSYRLACQTQLEALKGRRVWVGPLPHMPVIKDLVVDMRPFFEKVGLVMPWLEALSAPSGKEHLQSPQQRSIINEAVDCILCGICHSSCPMTWTKKDYLGPAALTKAYRFVADSRDVAAANRLALVNSEDGVWRCRTVFNCAEACPKNINPTDAIESLRRKLVSGRRKSR
ncbi:MAG: succinate dehydrogenase iron-sulfur subunit [Dehalococcoidia bacterium]|nr:succinate dehydrogenase iron-sulfur subunit [Dehalococcoidia bacterium]